MKLICLRSLGFNFVFVVRCIVICVVIGFVNCVVICDVIYVVIGFVVCDVIYAVIGS